MLVGKAEEEGDVGGPCNVSFCIHITHRNHIVYFVRSLPIPRFSTLGTPGTVVQYTLVNRLA